MPGSQVRGRCGARSTSPGWADSQTGRLQPRQQFPAAHRHCPQSNRVVAVILGHVIVITLKSATWNSHRGGNFMKFFVRRVAHHVAPTTLAVPPVAFVDQNHRGRVVSGRRSRRRNHAAQALPAQGPTPHHRQPTQTPTVGAWLRHRTHTERATRPRSSGDATRRRHHTRGSGIRTTAWRKVSSGMVD